MSHATLLNTRLEEIGYTKHLIERDDKNLFSAVAISIGLPENKNLALWSKTNHFVRTYPHLFRDSISDIPSFLMGLVDFDRHLDLQVLQVLSHALGIEFHLINLPTGKAHSIGPSMATAQTAYLTYDGEYYQAYQPIITPKDHTIATAHTPPRVATAFAPTTIETELTINPTPLAYAQATKIREIFKSDSIMDERTFASELPHTFVHGLTPEDTYLTRVLIAGMQGYKKLADAPLEKFRWTAYVTSVLCQTDCLTELRDNHPENIAATPTASAAAAATTPPTFLQAYSTNLSVLSTKKSTRLDLSLNCKSFLMTRLMNMLEIYFSINIMRRDDLLSLLYGNSASTKSFAPTIDDLELRENLELIFKKEINQTLIAYRIEAYHKLAAASGARIDEHTGNIANRKLAAAICTAILRLPDKGSLIIPLRCWKDHRIYLQVLYLKGHYRFLAHNYGQGAQINSSIDTKKIYPYLISEFSKTSLTTRGLDYLAKILSLDEDEDIEKNEPAIYRSTPLGRASLDLQSFESQLGGNCVAYGFTCAIDTCNVTDSDLNLRKRVIDMELMLLRPRLLGEHWPNLDHYDFALEALEAKSKKLTTSDTATETAASGPTK